MKTISTNPEAFESTYALLVRSEEKQRVETLIYTLLIVSTIFAVLQCRATRRLTKGVSSFSATAMLNETMTVNAMSRPRSPRSNPFSFTDSRRPAVSHFFSNKDPFKLDSKFPIDGFNASSF